MPLAASLAVAKPQEIPLRLSPMFGPNMVLQRGRPVPVWGWTTPGERVTVTFQQHSASTTADTRGRWQVSLPILSAGGPHELGVFDSDEALNLPNVLVGDVWLCSGQSNMAFPLSQIKNSTKEIDAADLPNIRLFKVGFNATDEPQDSLRGEWKVAAPNTAAGFSAVAFLFAKSIQASEDVPVGVIDASWGGSSAEAWTPYSGLSLDPELKPLLDVYERAKIENRNDLVEYRRWLRAPKKVFQTDEGNRGFGLGYHREAYDDSEWGTTSVPGYWEDLYPSMQFDGAVWFRTEVNLPQAMANQELTLQLGQIADHDFVYWNDQMVGSTTGTGDQEPSEIVRRYKIHPRLAREGKNTLAVRVFNRKDRGGFGSEPEDLFLQDADGAMKVSLAGKWKTKIETRLSPQLIRMREIPFGPGHPAAPSNLFNGMVSPMVPMALAGVAWYQGETNAPRAKQYKTLLPRLITSWRAAFRTPDLPFLVVQLPNFRERKKVPTEAEWAELREAQAKALNLPRTGLVVTIDLGDPTDIHPRDKLPLAERLADTARQVAYQSTQRGHAPVFDGYRVEAGAIRILVRHTVGSLRTSDGGPIVGFQIAGEDRVWQWAEARIEGESLVVSSRLVPDPKAVRYAWADNPLCNVVNRIGLPLAPFRTDTWPGLTDGRLIYESRSTR